MRDDTALWHLHGYCCCCRLSWPVCHGSLPDPTCAVCTRADPPVYQHLVYNLLPPRAMVAHCSDLDLVHHKKTQPRSKGTSSPSKRGRTSLQSVVALPTCSPTEVCVGGSPRHLALLPPPWRCWWYCRCPANSQCCCQPPAHGRQKMRSNICKINSILQIIWSDILWRYFQYTFSLGFVMGLPNLNSTCFWKDC